MQGKGFTVSETCYCPGDTGSLWWGPGRSGCTRTGHWGPVLMPSDVRAAGSKWNAFLSEGPDISIHVNLPRAWRSGPALSGAPAREETVKAGSGVVEVFSGQAGNFQGLKEIVEEVGPDVEERDLRSGSRGSKGLLEGQGWVKGRGGGNSLRVWILTGSVDERLIS